MLLTFTAIISSGSNVISFLFSIFSTCTCGSRGVFSLKYIVFCGVAQEAPSSSSNTTTNRLLVLCISFFYQVSNKQLSHHTHIYNIGGVLTPSVIPYLCC